MKKAIIWIFVGAGFCFGIIWYFDVEETGQSFSDFFANPIDGVTSLFSRFSLVVSGLFQRASGAVGGNVDAVALAAGKIAEYEGFSASAYPDPIGQTAKFSIGYGHQIVSGDGFDGTSTISESDALALLQQDIANFAECVDSSVTVPLTPQQQAALYSLCYNIGCAAFQNSTLLGDLNTGDYSQAQAQFAVWNKAGGVESSALDSRRASEAELFGDAGPLQDASDTVASVDDDSGASDD